MADERPNILLVMTDQQRGDCLGVDGHPVVQTPQLDEIAGQGARFRRAYTTCPSCVAARRSLMSGQFPRTHGLVGYRDGLEWNPTATLPGELRKAGYHTAIVGRNMHQHPFRKRFGFDEMVISGGGRSNNYSPWLNERAPGGGDYYGAGPAHNDWTARPWHLDEYLHQTNWTVSEALKFLDRRDPTQPYFLVVSFIAPHPPLIPPAFYMDRYLRMDLPEPAIGDWCAPPDNAAIGQEVAARRIKLHPEAFRSMQAGYFGLINHVDDQLRRIFNPANCPLDKNTVVIFTSDHGELLGDHHMFRKSEPYEGSVRIPLLVRGPEMGIGAGNVRDEAVCLEDIMPTCLDLAGLPIPPSVDGRSLVPLLRGETPRWRDCLHGEHAPNAHFLTDGRWKFVWRTQEGTEQFFDLASHPKELRNLVTLLEHREQAATWRDRLIEHLRDRPEGFVEGGKLIADRPYTAALPHALHA